MNNFVNKNTGISKRSSSRVVDTDRFNPGPFEAEVVNHLDTSYMGGLEVRLLTTSGSGNSIDTPGETVPVKYLSPFYGVTPNKGITKNSGHENSQKSYGMWFVPPDIGTRVLVVFAEGGQGYWIGCIQDDYMNMMLPGGTPATTYNDQDEGSSIPVGEYNKKTEEGVSRDPTQYVKPANTRELDILKEQGLDKCKTRGLTTSSARRELPSGVFGISTPGPPDRKGPKVQYGGDFAGIETPHNRLGGSSIVFDDGDCNLQRKKHAKDGPPEYANVDSGESGDDTIPHNEMVKIRTRTGHQILLHNSEDLIYICNSRGTTWFEMTSNGKIDIYTKDDFSVHSEANINFLADKSIYMEAKEEIHIKSGEDMFVESLQKMDVRSAENMSVLTDENLHMVVAESLYQKIGEDWHLKAGSDGKITVSGDIEQKSENYKATASSKIEESAPSIILKGSRIDMNGPDVSEADEADEAEDAEEAKGSQRIPNKEPWDLHENLHESEPPEVADTFKKGK